MSKVVILYLVAYFSFTEAQSVCSTPTGSSGVCKSLYECVPLLNLIQKPDKTAADIDLLKKSKCGFDGNIPKVCCPNACNTPDGKPGTCVNIQSCPQLASKLQPPITEENKQYVNKSRCNDGEKYSVCCSIMDQPLPKPGSCASISSTFPPHSNTSCCGLDVEGRRRLASYGGFPTEIDAYPWAVLIEHIQGSKVKLLCGGSLISGRYVVTAAHCVTGYALQLGTPTNIRLGEYDITHDGIDCKQVEAGGEDCTDGSIVIPIEKIIPHPEYKKTITNTYNDIALIRMAKTAPYTDFISPICLPTSDVTASPPDQLYLYVTGWGAVSDTQPSSPIKLHVDLPYTAQNVCQAAYKTNGRNTVLVPGQICAGGVSGKDSCKGDSGGPLMYLKYDGHLFWELVGIVSFGPTPCGLPDVPGVYTKVYDYLNWIRSVIVE